MKTQEKIEQAMEIAKAEREAMLIYDDESHTTVKVTKEMQEEAWAEHEALKAGVFQVAQSLFRIKTKKLYLALGFNNFQDYFQSAGFGKMTAYRYLNIGKTFSLTDGKTSPRGDVPTGERGENENVPTWERDNWAELEGLGTHKLYEITRFTQDQISELLKGSPIISDSGESISLDEIRQHSAAEIGKKVSRMLQKRDKEKVSTLKADLDLLKAEKKALQNRLKNMESEIEEARQLREKYEPADRTIKGKTEAIKRAQKAMGDFFRAMNSAEVAPDDPRELVDMFNALVGSIHRFTEENLPTYELIIRQALGED